MLRWIRRCRRRTRGGDVPRAAPAVTPGQEEAAAALHRAQQALHQVENLTPQVRATAERLKERRAENRFAESIWLTFGEHQ